jgi:hypothetical protein
MAFRDPCRVVAQALSQHDEIDDLNRIGAAGKRDADLSHLSLSSPYLRYPRSILRYFRIGC